MVKITNVFGDVKTGKQEGAVYQRHYGKQIRRVLKEKKNANTQVQLEQRARFKAGINFAKGLTKPERDFIKSYMAEAEITAPDGLPTTWYTYAKKIAMSVPRVVFETGEGEAGFSGTYAGWSYRKPITLTNSGSTLTDYAMLVTLTTENFTYSKCDANGSDIRFAASDGTTALSYWIEDWNYNGTSKIWVKVDSVPNGENICLYIYYGNASAESESNGENTFIFFDDYSTDTTGDYSHQVAAPTGAYIFSITNQILKAGRDVSPYGRDTWYQNVSLTGKHAIRLKVTDLSETPINQIVGIGANPAPPGSWKAKDDFACTNTNYNGGQGLGTFDVLYNCELSGTLYLIISTYDPSTNTTNYIKIDFIAIRKYTSPEPTYQLGTESTSESTTEKLQAFTIHHPAIKSYEVLDTNIKEEGLSNLEDYISTSASRSNLDVTATTLKVVTLADQEYLFEIL